MLGCVRVHMYVMSYGATSSKWGKLRLVKFDLEYQGQSPHDYLYVPHSANQIQQYLYEESKTCLSNYDSYSVKGDKCDLLGPLY